MAIVLTQTLPDFGVVGLHAPAAYPFGNIAISLLCGVPAGVVVAGELFVVVLGLDVVLLTGVVVPSPATSLSSRLVANQMPIPATTRTTTTAAAAATMGHGLRLPPDGGFPWCHGVGPLGCCGGVPPGGVPPQLPLPPKYCGAWVGWFGVGIGPLPGP